MPRKKTGALRKKKPPRSLWLNIKVRAPKRVSRKKILETLIASIEKGDYRYPKKWKVILLWRNRANAKMKAGEFTFEMLSSAQSSTGFDSAVTEYLEGKLDE